MRTKSKTIFGFLLSFVLTTLCLDSFSQKTHNHQMRVAIDYSFNGMGDVWGWGFSSEYLKYFRKKIFWSVDFGATIHDSNEPIFFVDSSGSRHDISIRNTSAGFQIQNYIGYSLIRNKFHEIQARLGGVLRYQSTSVPDVTNILFPALTGIPFPVYVFEQTSPQHTLAIGASMQILYNYTFSNNFCIGIGGGIQTDTNGDRILPLSLTVGKRF